MTSQATTARRRLDARLEPVRPLLKAPRPPHGWLRAIREALGMSTTELAKRMRVTQSRVSRIEQAEVAGTIKLETLERAADALNCDLVYLLVPRTTLDQAVHDQARRRAAELLRPVAHSMRLEDQSVDTSSHIDDLAGQMIDRRGLWTDSSVP